MGQRAVLPCNPWPLPATICQRADRGFLGRAITYLAGEEGIRQFLDIGTGLPTADNTHEVAQRVAPESRIVYADNDPLVLSHARALAPGSFLAINHSTSAIHGPAMEAAVAHWNEVGTPPMTLRSPQQIAGFFEGLDLLPPGWCPAHAGAPASARPAGNPPRSTNSVRRPQTASNHRHLPRQPDQTSLTRHRGEAGLRGHPEDGARHTGTSTATSTP